MAYDVHPRNGGRPGLAVGLLAALIMLVVLTGGASSPGALGQPVVRTGAVLLAAVAIGAGLKFDLARYRGPAVLLAAAVALPFCQLLPLPPGLWHALPGRAVFDPSAIVPEIAGAWRPAAITPDAAWNALFSLTVPACTLLLLAATPRPQLQWVSPLLVTAVGLSSVVAALQFAGAAADNPLINERVGFASGLFANRNHQALFLAIGVAAAAQWGTVRPFAPFRAAIAGATVGWFLLMLLATGSRTGLVLGLGAIAGGSALVFGALRRSGTRIPRTRLLLFGGIAGALLVGIVTVSVAAGRSESINRFNDAALGEDMRVRALPVVLDMVRTYLPLGGGQGGFATLFKAVEPDALLKPTSFNHAHDDYLELLIEAGLPGALLLAAALAWFARHAWRAWRLAPAGEIQRARLGTVVVVLVLMASATDYPARTPVIMMVLVLAAGWLRLERPESDFTR